jgi:hypothetical protein
MSMVGTRIRALQTALALGLVLLAPQAAIAASSGGLGTGVHIDPGSPAAKEYAIPLGSARGNGNPTNAGTGQLFGNGITKANTASSPAASPQTPAATGTHAVTTTKRRDSQHRRGATARSGHHVHSAGGPAASRPRTPSPQNAIGTGSSSGAGITWMLGAAVLVLLLGGAGGTLLARRARTRDPDPYPG